MPLSPPKPREALHRRKYDFQGFKREDGLWEIEGRLWDDKTYDFHYVHHIPLPAGEPVHDMSLRLAFDDSLKVFEIEAVMDTPPWLTCRDCLPNFQGIVGLSMGKGWPKAVREVVGRAKGCTHLVEMLVQMGTVAYQLTFDTLEVRRAAETPDQPPSFLNTCYSLTDQGYVVQERWTAFAAEHKKAED